LPTVRAIHTPAPNRARATRAPASRRPLRMLDDGIGVRPPRALRWGTAEAETRLYPFGPSDVSGGWYGEAGWDEWQERSWFPLWLRRRVVECLGAFHLLAETLS
jgi:hypothetical protein